ncbi:6-phosphogluconate dehydrogenase, decarboxylating [Lactiplantibacillus plantarum subsp. plantarum]|nr:6-phosphogluconate dehydrogenase, decarboxylating [Lactiplantibacillus plantarum subsp. plantarum]
MSNEKPQIGVIGMAVMGKNLALNIESRGYKVAILIGLVPKLKRSLRTMLTSN